MKVVEGLGTTMDVVLVNGLLQEGQQIVVCGLGAPIVTSIRSLLTPHPMKARAASPAATAADVWHCLGLAVLRAGGTADGQ